MTLLRIIENVRVVVFLTQDSIRTMDDLFVNIELVRNIHEDEVIDIDHVLSDNLFERIDYYDIREFADVCWIILEFVIHINDQLSSIRHRWQALQLIENDLQCLSLLLHIALIVLVGLIVTNTHRLHRLYESNEFVFVFEMPFRQLFTSRNAPRHNIEYVDLVCHIHKDLRLFVN